jgi:thiopurine S-methyltransferase
MNTLHENREFWEKAWAEGRTRFHRDQYNQTLTTYAPNFFGPGSKVLVPLCGKSIDMLWLAARGYGVSGVEVARKPLEDFITENNLDGTWENERFQVKGQRLNLYNQDFFLHDGRYEAIYDRACLVALPSELRKRMAERYRDLLMPNGKILLLTIEHDNGDGPPFNVSEEEVRNLFAENFSIEIISQMQEGDRTIKAQKLVLIK